MTDNAIKIPSTLDNSVYSFMKWSSITNPHTMQYKLRQKYDKKGGYDGKGLADIKGRKVIACTPMFGEIGDEIEVTFKKGVDYWNTFHKTLFAVIGDYKNEKDPNCDKFGHLYTEENGQYKQRSVIEFIVGDDFSGHIKDEKNFPDLKDNPVTQIEKTGVNFLSDEEPK